MAQKSYRGRRHRYYYYNEPWTDYSTGTEYQSGYYDENGNHYDHVAFQENGKYENVVCHCPYCGQDTIMNLDNTQGTTQSLQCPHCTGMMEIVSELDELIENRSEPVSEYDDQNSITQNHSSYNSISQFEDSVERSKKKRKRWNVALIILASIVVLSAERGIRQKIYHLVSPPSQVEQVETVHNNQQVSFKPMTVEDVFTSGESAIYLEFNEDGSFHVVNDVLRADKFLSYDKETDCYYDSDSDCYVWYNTDVYPNAMQYWYEGISSDYGDYGWMEFDGVWHIEVDDGQWIDLPAEYDTSSLWHINV